MSGAIGASNCGIWSKANILGYLQGDKCSTSCLYGFVAGGNSRWRKQPCECSWLFFSCRRIPSNSCESSFRALTEAPDSLGRWSKTRQVFGWTQEVLLQHGMVGHPGLRPRSKAMILTLAGHHFSAMIRLHLPRCRGWGPNFLPNPLPVLATPTMDGVLAHALT